MRAAVYEGLADTARLDGHARAAQLLAASGEAPERVAAHLLLIPPAGDSCVVGTLRRAADQAFARGSPDSAVSYLEQGNLDEAEAILDQASKLEPLPRSG